VLWLVPVTETAQVELRRGRVEAPAVTARADAAQAGVRIAKQQDLAKLYRRNLNLKAKFDSAS